MTISAPCCGSRASCEEAEASIRRALALAPGFTRALDNLGAMLKDQGRLNEAIAIYRQLLQISAGG